MSSYVNAVRYMSMYTYSSLSEPWMLEMRGTKPCEEQCTAEPHCTGFATAAKGHCHLFYIPLCAYPYVESTSVPSNTLIVAKSDPAPVWKQRQSMAVMPSSKPSEATVPRARITMGAGKNATKLSESGADPVSWISPGSLSCAEMCQRAQKLFKFDCALVIDERDSNSRARGCALYEDGDVPAQLEASIDSDVYLNTALVAMHGCSQDDVADSMADTLIERPSPLDMVPLTSDASTAKMPFSLIAGVVIGTLTCLL